MKHNDRISKPKTGFFFPLSFPEAIHKISSLHFEMQTSGHFNKETKEYVRGELTRDERTDLFFLNIEKSFEHGCALASFRRLADIALFSLPEDLFSKQVAISSLDIVLQEFANIDRLVQQNVKPSQFLIYRGYIGQLGKITITRNLISSTSRPYLDLERALNPQKLRGEEVVLSQFQL